MHWGSGFMSFLLIKALAAAQYWAPPYALHARSAALLSPCNLRAPSSNNEVPYLIAQQVTERDVPEVQPEVHTQKSICMTQVYSNMAT
jgi:hypothetical protein